MTKKKLRRLKHEPVKRCADDLTLDNLLADRELFSEYEFAPHERVLIEITYLMSYRENIHKTRKDGKTTRFVHPWNVARILVRHGTDYITICAGLLHDSIEDSIDKFFDRYRSEHGRFPGDDELEVQETRFLDRIESKLVTEFRRQTYTPYLLEQMSVGSDNIPKIYRDVTTFMRYIHQTDHQDDDGELCHPTDEEFGREIRALMRRLSHQECEQFRLDVDNIDYHLREGQSARDAAQITDRLLEKYGIDDEHASLLYTLNMMHFNIERIIGIDEALTRKKSKYYPESINYMFDHTHDVRLKLRTTMVKLSDRCHNIQDVNPAVFNFLLRLTQCFKNIYVQSRTVQFLLEWEDAVRRDKTLEEYYQRTARIYNDCAYYTWVELDRLAGEVGAMISEDRNRALRAKLQRYEYEREGLEVRTNRLQLKDKHFDNVSNEFLDYMYTPKGERYLTALGQTWYDEEGNPREKPNYERLFEYVLAHRAVATKLRWAWRKGYYIRGLTDLAKDKEMVAKRREMEV